MIKVHQEQIKSLKKDLNDAKAKEKFYSELINDNEDESLITFYKDERDYWREAIIFLRYKIREERAIIDALKIK